MRLFGTWLGEQRFVCLMCATSVASGVGMNVGLSLAATLAADAAAPLVFLGDLRAAAIGMALWGIGMGAQESVMRAQVAAMAPEERRGTAFGLMNTIYGFAWFAGSALLGLLYDMTAPLFVAAVAVFLQLASLPIFWRLIRKKPGSINDTG